MAPRIGNRIFLNFLCTILIVLSPASFAFSQKVIDQILEQNPDNIKMGLIIFTGVFVFLLLLVVIVNFQLGSLRNKHKKHNKELTDKQSLLNNFKVGMLHVNLAGEIIFANRAAAFFLGSKEDKLINKPLIDVFWDEAQESIYAALTSNLYVAIQTYVTASKRHLQLGFSKQSDINHDIASVVSLTDVSNYQHQIEQQSSKLNSLNQCLQQSGLAKLTIDFDDNTFTSNQLFADFLLAAEPLSGELTQFKKILNSNQVFEWNKALEASKKQHQMDTCFEFLFLDKNENATQGSEPKEVQPLNTIPLRLIGISRNKNDQGETTRLDFLVQNQSDIEEQRSLHQASQQRVKTLLNTSPNPVYLLDEQGKFIDCNHAFELLFKQKLSKIKNKNIQALGMLPAEIRCLHTGNNSNFSSVNVGHDKAFTWQLADDISHSLQLKLKFFLDKNKKRAGVVGVIQDVTALKLAQSQLEQARKHFITILDLAPIAVATIDADDRVIRANIAMTDRLGLSETELKKDTFYQLFNDASNAGKAAKKIHQTGRLRGFTAHLKGKNEELHPSELHVDCLNKEKQEYLCWILDRTKEQFHQDTFDGLLQYSSMPIAILGEQGFSKLNPAASAFFNVKDEHELLGTTPFAPELNIDQKASEELERHLTKVKLDGQAKSLQWEHQVGQVSLPCLATYVPMYKGQAFDSIVCMWTDFRVLQQAHQNITENLQEFQYDYNQSRSELSEAQNANRELTCELEESTAKVLGLQTQQNLISDTLQHSEEKYKTAQKDRLESEHHADILKQEKLTQQTKMDGFVVQIDGLKGAIEQKDLQIKEVVGQINSLQSRLTSSSNTSEKLRQSLVNQRKASVQVEEEHRNLEQTYKIAESELSNNVRHVEHLQNKMQKIEEMSNQQKGDMQQQQSQLVQQLKVKQQQLEQRTVELTDVENRVVTQKEMIQDTNEQWRKHHDEIEQQKLQLQQALIEAEKQNSQIQQKFEENLEQLQEAQSQVSQVSQIQSGEQILQGELNQARSKAEQLQQRIQQQEDHERKLQDQIEQQQQSLYDSEKSIHCLKEKQSQLTEQLQAVQQQYSNSKESLSDQHSDHAELAQQLKKLEQDLYNRQAQLGVKENALHNARQKLESNQTTLVEQENQAPSEIANIVMPDNPEVWFDLLSYLQNQNVTKPLSFVLNELMDELEKGIKETDSAVDEDDVTAILRGARKLVIIANKVNSEALTDVVTRLESDCSKGLVDNISISWPTVQRSLNNSLRVIYSHLNN